jgi:hypothetical protein
LPYAEVFVGQVIRNYQRVIVHLSCSIFLKLICYTVSRYKVYKDKLQNCSCTQFHYIGTYKQVEKNSMTNNRGGNNGSEK